MRGRRDFVLWLAVAGLSPWLLNSAAQSEQKPTKQEKINMYGIIGKMLCHDGQRDALASILLKGIAGMSGCLSYIVANDQQDPNALWITEVWVDKAHHAASLSLPSVQQAIQQGRPLIAGFGERFETTPIGGYGL